MSLALGLLVAAGGVITGRWLARRLRARGPLGAAPSLAGEPSDGELPATMPCKLGDVVVRTAERDEAWLAGALVFREEQPVAALFVAPEAGQDRALLARAAVDELTWLSPIAQGALALPGEPPPSIVHAGLRFERLRRLPVRVARVGSGAPDVGDRAIVAEYAGPALERIVVVAGNTRTMSWLGVALSKDEYDVLPAGKGSVE